jgi:hypothetical protein
MTRDTALLVSMVTLAVAAIVVGCAGWVLWSRGRAPHTTTPTANDHPPVAEES